ncbi:DivIVA domain-containing protein [Spirosoma validum]|uniref:DivIVA domain-containing protein n=1 Tax=Spirosoma validum TaxID=2771355 RepID=A0A927GEE0_9BACT|nr:DivIVA domain-containing protein [Spirosoma validum]MBD2754541.1 DivIVA domain-containing protein [Spirosoma validum]
MKFTPIEIRQHTFDKGLRGYKTEEVDAFLASLAEEWERVTSDYKMLKMQLELAEKELGKLKEVEMTLFRTLKTAEDTSTQITEQANKAGEKYIGEAKQKADSLLADAKKRSALMVQDAENQARYLKDNILNDLKSLEHDFKALEGYKENLSVQIRTLAGNAVDSVERFEKKFTKQNLKGKIDEVATQIKEELKQEDAKKALKNEQQPDTTPSPAAPASSVANLPPLTQREPSIPEAIPVDESVIEKLDKAIQHSSQPEAIQESVSENNVKAIVDDKEPASTLAEVNTPEPEPIPVKAAEEDQPKKGGSFFDQI